jgi:Spy/CpxP family protein refolding chaperone
MVATLAAGSLGLVTAVSAMPPGGGPGCGQGGYRMNADQRFGAPGARLERLAARLDMTEAQRAEVRAIFEGSRDEMVALREQMKANRTDIRELMYSGDFDEAAVRRIAAEQGDLKAEMIVLRARQRAEMRAVLTDEQISQLEQMRQRRQGRGY